ncbi:hypothetical protein RVIR1_06070 [Candidatus Rickettsiella viridis]|uniref:Uncharacterized protein n=1 Tax=Candidatus Rickettsiella viridis TaxID=676208 RepID=A0A2Z5UUE7_9COXI|nr:hypothetical protein RVIR1_06070 [Candidatus Rickettsiella viridis]
MRAPQARGNPESTEPGWPRSFHSLAMTVVIFLSLQRKTRQISFLFPSGSLPVPS